MRGIELCLQSACFVRHAKLTVMSFLYLGSLQFSASTQRIASLRSRDLQTSLRPLTRPIVGWFSSSCHQSLWIRLWRSLPPGVGGLTVVEVGLLDHTLDGILDVVGFFFFNLDDWGNFVAAQLEGDSTYASISDISARIIMIDFFIKHSSFPSKVKRVNNSRFHFLKNCVHRTAAFQRLDFVCFHPWVRDINVSIGDSSILVGF